MIIVEPPCLVSILSFETQNVKKSVPNFSSAGCKVSRPIKLKISQPFCLLFVCLFLWNSSPSRRKQWLELAFWQECSFRVTMHFSTSGLLTISICASHTCTVSSQLAFENTAWQPVHKGDEDYYNYLISPQTICLFCDLSSCCLGMGVSGRNENSSTAASTNLPCPGPGPRAPDRWRWQATGWVSSKEDWAFGLD